MLMGGGAAGAFWAVCDEFGVLGKTATRGHHNLSGSWVWAWVFRSPLSCYPSCKKKKIFFFCLLVSSISAVTQKAEHWIKLVTTSCSFDLAADLIFIFILFLFKRSDILQISKDNLVGMESISWHTFGRAGCRSSLLKLYFVPKLQHLTLKTEYRMQCKPQIKSAGCAWFWGQVHSAEADADFFACVRGKKKKKKICSLHLQQFLMVSEQDVGWWPHKSVFCNEERSVLSADRRALLCRSIACGHLL